MMTSEQPTTRRAFTATKLAAIFAIAACAPESNQQDVYPRSACCQTQPEGPLTFSGTITVKGSVASSVEKGPYERGGEMFTTSDRALAAAKDHAKHYDGPAKYDVTYTVVTKADKSVDPTKSSVKFTKVSFTHAGTLTESKFETVSIPITGITLGDCDELVSFTLKGDKWYKDIPGSVEDTGITGSVNLKTKATSYTGTYRSKSNGAKYKYVATSPAEKPPCPEPEVKCCENPFGDDLVACPIPVPVEPCDPPAPPQDPIPGPLGDHDIYEPMNPDPELP